MSKSLPEIIDVDQLREEVGDPTTNSQFGSYVSDSMLQGIIDRHVDWLESQTHQRLKEGAAKPIKRVNPVSVDLAEENAFPGLASGTLDPDYFPYATEGIITSPSTYSGEALDYKRNLIRESKKVFYDAYFFDIENNTVLVTPKDVTKVTLFCPTRNMAIREVMADVISDVNANIIQRTRQMIQAREQEFAEPAYAGGEGVVFEEE
jgi:hypothetical protein